jgi:3-oxoacyl-[acyl-carrier protein] reductase
MHQELLERLKGKTAWITGGKRVGHVVALALAELGVNLVLSYRSSREEASHTASEAGQLGVRTLTIQADVSDRENVVRAVDEARKTFPAFDILVNMASVFAPIKLADIRKGDMEANILAHLYGTLWPSQVISEYMPRGGHIINISDRTAVGHVYPEYLPYAVTKGSVASLTRALAVELGEKGIFVNDIAPGPIIKPPHISPKEWKEIREQSGVKYPVDDAEAMRQFALQVVHLSLTTMASGSTSALDQGQNLVCES